MQLLVREALPPLEWSDALKDARATLSDLRIQRRKLMLELRGHNLRLHDLMTSVRCELAASQLDHRSFPAPVVARPNAALQKVSRRELGVLRLVAAGMANKEIALRLGISEQTVRNHLSHLFPKLGVVNRTEAVIAAIQAGLLSV